MKTQNTFTQFALFLVIGFGPLMLVYGVLVLGLVLNALISVSGDTAGVQIEFALLTLGLIGVSGAALLAGFRWFVQSSGWLSRLGVLYGCWLILAAAPAFLLTTSMAGVSMAAVDGAVSSRDLLLLSIREAFSLLLVSHLEIIPWVLGAAWLLGRLMGGQPGAAAGKAGA